MTRKQNANPWSGKEKMNQERRNPDFASQKTVLLVTFLDIKGIVHYEYLEEGQTINKESYLNIMRRITIIFKENGLLDIVNGKSLFEDLKDETGKDKWSLKDAKAQKYIMLTIEKNVLTHILNCKTSKEMYEKLVAIYQREDEQLKCKLLKEFHGFKFDKNTDMATNISRMQNLVFKLNNVKQEIEESFVISKILLSNPPNGYTAENRTSTTLQNRTTSPALGRAMVTIAHQDNVLQPTNKLSFISPLQPHHMVESSVGPAPQAANINIGYGETPCFNPEEEDI
ncbi:hypothetical protein LAZ67_X002358 [Cordylochernes scorpioides]|uniref:Uncharacterized protein n=1 Tax=Cordylochernes scorpioides TaxID=51811 RepID=A0ABY6LTS2_9ARAC|nr:hypothetical protein LAZ67_X002358 [Cordylochernes scorpioides]